jgi:hypothetical protein
MQAEELFGRDPIQRRVRVTTPRIRRTALAHLKVEVSKILAFRRTHSPDLRSAAYCVPVSDLDGLQVRIDGRENPPPLRRGGIRHTVGKHDDLPPALAWISGVDDMAIAAGENRIAQIRVPAADPIQVISKVTAGAEGAGIIRECAIFRTHGGNKVRGQRELRRLRGREPQKCSIERRGRLECLVSPWGTGA